MPGGIHLLVGLLITFFFSSGKRHPHANLGMIVGSILPDIDLVFSSIAISLYYLFVAAPLGKPLDVYFVIGWHRTLTHSLFVIVPLYLIFRFADLCDGWRKSSSKEKEDEDAALQDETDNEETTEEVANQQTNSELNSVAASSSSSSPFDLLRLLFSLHKPVVYLLQKIAALDFLTFSFARGCCLGMLVHVVLDIFYMKGVKLLWPFYETEFFVELPMLWMYEFSKYTPIAQKLWIAFDCINEALFYSVLLLGSRAFGGATEPSSSSQKQQGVAEVTEVPLKTAILRRFTWRKVFIYLSIFQFILIPTILAIVLLRHPDIKLEAYVIAMNVPGITFIGISIFAPLLLRKELETWSPKNLCYAGDMERLKQIAVNTKLSITTRRIFLQPKPSPSAPNAVTKLKAKQKTEHLV